jgi:hypothetical protein
MEKFRWRDSRYTWPSRPARHGTQFDAMPQMGTSESVGMARRYARFATPHLAPHAEIVAGILKHTNAAQPSNDVVSLTR